MSITDSEFGVVPCRRVITSKYVRIRLQPDGTLSATLPPRAPLQLVQQLLDDSREELRELVAGRKTNGLRYTDGMMIGASHKLTIAQSSSTKVIAKIQGQSIFIATPYGVSAESAEVQTAAREAAKKALTKEAKAYLPRRLRYLADIHGFRYQKVRFSNAKGRWGSCSSEGTISLNIALMRLDRSLIDYVLAHELTHTEHMNHSPQFWQRLEQIYPGSKLAKKRLKEETPYL